MGVLKNIKKVCAKPIKTLENKVIPVINSINTYLDSWFPQDKWNWRKVAIAWAAVQAFVITGLEIYVAYKNVEQVSSVYHYYKSSNDIYILSQLAVADSLAVYHMIFIVALFFQFYLICDTVSKSSTLQLIPGTIFSIGITVYSVVQYIQAESSFKSKYIELMIAKDPESRNKIHQSKAVEIVIIVLMCLFCMGWVIITLRLYKVFGWNVFKQLGADIGVKNRLKLYQTLLAFLKIDIFFFTAFTLQFFIFVITYVKTDGLKIQIINIVFLVICFSMPFLGFAAIKKENYKIMCTFIFLLSISIGYMAYNFVDIIIDTHKNSELCDGNTKICITARYRNCSNSLSMACISSIILGTLTFVLSLISFRNFPKGLRIKEKSNRPSSSHHSSLSSSNRTQRRWSIE